MLVPGLLLALLVLAPGCAKRDQWHHPAAPDAYAAQLELRCHQLATTMVPGTSTAPARAPYMPLNNDLAFLSNAMGNTQMQIAAMPRLVTDFRVFDLCMEANGFYRGEADPPQDQSGF